MLAVAYPREQPVMENADRGFFVVIITIFLDPRWKMMAKYQIVGVEIAGGSSCGWSRNEPRNPNKVP